MKKFSVWIPEQDAMGQFLMTFVKEVTLNCEDIVISLIAEGYLTPQDIAFVTAKQIKEGYLIINKDNNVIIRLLYL